jgi:hypothetical protein
MRAENGLYHCGQAGAGLVTVLSVGHGRVSSATASGELSQRRRPPGWPTQRAAPAISMSSPLSSVARQRKRATVWIRARMRYLGVVMPFTMKHHYHATVE